MALDDVKTKIRNLGYDKASQITVVPKRNFTQNM